jgi:4-aminobutyrate aminotransferase
MSALPEPAHHDTPPALDPRFIAGDNAQWQQRKGDATPRGVAVLESFYAARAENAELWDIEGRRYIDFGSGIAVLNTGHRHPRVVDAVRAQLDLFTHTAYQVVPYASYVALAERINERLPGAWPKKTAFFTTGAEAVENAVKIARAATGRPGVIAFGGGFHGRTYFGMALTGKVVPYKAGFGPFPGEVYHAPFPSPVHGISVDDALDGVRALFKNDIEARRVAAFIFEPIQGEGGFVPAPREFVSGLREIADEHGILLIADEIQTGFGRTGKLFAIEHHDAAIDLVTFAKSLAGGLPLAGVAGRATLMDACEPGGLGGTYAGNPLAVAAAHAVLDVIDDERLLDRAMLLGQRLQRRLDALRARVPQMADVRGLGSMIGVEFIDPVSRQPLADFAKRVQAQALERGLILLVCGTHGNVIRFLHPLTTPDEVFAEALDIVEAALINAQEPR